MHCILYNVCKVGTWNSEFCRCLNVNLSLCISVLSTAQLRNRWCVMARIRVMATAVRRNAECRVTLWPWMSVCLSAVHPFVFQTSESWSNDHCPRNHSSPVETLNLPRSHFANDAEVTWIEPWSWADSFLRQCSFYQTFSWSVLETISLCAGHFMTF